MRIRRFCGSRPTLKADAGQVVKRIEGVERVTNNIEVLPLSSNDDRIRLAIYRALFSDTSLERYALQAVPPIHIIVKGGHVTLEGVVANEADRTVANIRAIPFSGLLYRPPKGGCTNYGTQTQP